MGVSRKILLTTSRNPTPKIRTFCHDLVRIIPRIVSVNRGKLSMDGVAEKALECDADRVIIVDRGQGGPSKIELFQIGESGLISVFPIFSFFSIQLQREFEPKRLKPIRSIAITIPSKGNEEIIRVANSLSQFFNIPIFSANEKPSMYMAKMPISYDSSGRIQITFNAQNIETGPRITLSGILWKKSK